MKNPKKPPKKKKPGGENKIYKMPFEEIIKRGVRIKPPVKKDK